VRVRFGVLLAVVGGSLSIGAVEASAALEFCERASSGRQCASLTVPLDRSGVVPGTVKLHIERQRAKRAARPPLLLIAGGPGQSATDAFDSDTVERLFGTEIRSRDVVVMDLRGTGRSGAIDCPALQRGSTKAAAIAACAAKLGARRDFYSSVAIAQDIDAVRDVLGADRVAVYGISYGTYVAQVYARRYPAHIDRLVLDSVVGPAGVDPFERSSMAAVPGVVGTLCGKRGCRRFMRDPDGDTARLATRLDHRPLSGYVVNRYGRRQPATIDGQGLLALTIASDSNSMIGSLLPGAVRNALRGDPAPLLQARSVWARTPIAGSPRKFSAGASVATLCPDTLLLPWDATTPLAERGAAAARFVAAQPAGAFAPFGATTALRSDVLEACKAWPARSGPIATPAIGPLPDVPALLLTGGMDVRTPVADARAVAAQMPRARIVSVRRAGHDVLSWDFMGCASRAARRFLAGGEPGRCGPGPQLASPYPAPPHSLRDLSFAGKSRRTAVAVAFTTLDAAVGTLGRLSNLSSDPPAAALRRLVGGRLMTGALRGGRYSVRLDRFVIGFHRASAVSGVRVNGRMRPRQGGFVGDLSVSGAAAAHGRLKVRGSKVTGRLGGRRVRLDLADIGTLFGDVSSASAALAGTARALRHKLIR
jgi:pimeloyl-ACP methyl ester carboxylesterase